MTDHELRIGNWVMYGDVRDCKMQVNEYLIKEFIDHPDRFKSIKLTEEWIKNLGFGRRGHKRGWWVEDLYHIKLTRESGEYIIRAVGSDSSIRISRVYYVHELQNLYSSLGSKIKPLTQHDDWDELKYLEENVISISVM